MGKNIKNLHIGDNDLIGNKFNGHDLHLYLQNCGIESFHLVNNKYSDDNSTYVYNDSLFKTYTPGLLRNILFLDADVVHLHLIHNTLFDIHYLPIMSTLKSIVWSLHDPWVLSGHCVHHGDCNKWQSHCLDCPYPEVDFAISKDTTALDFELKKRAIQNSHLHCIVASKWMEDKIKSSPIFTGQTIHRVPFGINQELFKPKDIRQAKRELGIDEHELVLFARTQIAFKGLDILRETLGNIRSNTKVTLLTVGQRGLLDEYTGKLTIREHGWLKDDAKLIQLYQACDLFLMPSEQETFGMMAIEAMSCGKMVLALEGTALPDVVDAPHCGIAVGPKAYAHELQRLLDNPDEVNARGELSLTFARANYGHQHYVERILEVYRCAMEDFTMTDTARLILQQLKAHAGEAAISSNITPGASYPSFFSRYHSHCTKGIAYLRQHGARRTIKKIAEKLSEKLAAYSRS